MDASDPWTWTLVSSLLALIFFLYALRARSRYARERSAGRSLATRFGQINEQFAPFLASYPYDPKDFRFLGTPIDGVQFNGEEVIFVEIKSSRSKLNERQRSIRDAVQAGRVRWMEFRIG